MPRAKCTVCVHADLNAIDESLRSGNPPLRELAKQTGLHASALFRHKQHQRALKGSSLKNIPEEIRKLKIMLNSAKRRKDTSAALAISREIRAWLAFEAKTRPVVPQDRDIAAEVPQHELIALARALIESLASDDREIQQWILTLAERIQATSMVDTETDEG
jgi:hypothetical protein